MANTRRWCYFTAIFLRLLCSRITVYDLSFVVRSAAVCRTNTRIIALLLAAGVLQFFCLTYNNIVRTVPVGENHAVMQRAAVQCNFFSSSSFRSIQYSSSPSCRLYRSVLYYGVVCSTQYTLTNYEYSTVVPTAVLHSTSTVLYYSTTVDHRSSSICGHARWGVVAQYLVVFCFCFYRDGVR